MNKAELEFFRARAAQCREEGRLTTLDNVRERCARAEAAWNGLIAQRERFERDRAASARRKAEAGEAADMLRERAVECRALADKARTTIAREAFQMLAAQFEEQANGMQS